MYKLTTRSTENAKKVFKSWPLRDIEKCLGKKRKRNIQVVVNEKLHILSATPLNTINVFCSAQMWRLYVYSVMFIATVYSVWGCKLPALMWRG